MMVSALQQIPSWFRQTSVGRKMAKEAEASVAEERQELVAEIAAVRAERAEQSPGLAKAASAAKAARDRAKLVLERAEVTFQEATRADYGFNARCDHRIAVLERRLAESADPEIDRFISEMFAEFDRTRHASLQSWEHRGKWNGLLDVYEWDHRDNGVARKARILAIRQAMVDVEALKLKVDVDVEAELSKLRDGLPSVDKMEDTSTTNSPIYHV